MGGAMIRTPESLEAGYGPVYVTNYYVMVSSHVGHTSYIINDIHNQREVFTFSAMQTKKYLRSTIGQKRLNAIMLLHVQKDL